MATKPVIWTKATISKLDKLYNEYKKRGDFLANAEGIMPKNYLDRFFYDRKWKANKIKANDSPVSSPPITKKVVNNASVSAAKPIGITGGNKPFDTSPNDDGTKNVPPEPSVATNESAQSSSSEGSTARNLTDADVVVGRAMESPEAGDIKDIYKNMLKEEISTEQPSKITTEQTNESTDTKTKVTSTIPNQYSTSPSALIATLIKSVDNNLLFGGASLLVAEERKLAIDEETNITNAAEAIPNADIKGLDDPYINLAIMGFGIPAINRVDLIVAKINELRNKGGIGKVNVPKKSPFDFSGGNKQNVKDAEFKVQETPAQEPTAPQVNAPNYNENQLNQVNAWKSVGFKVDPAYDFGGAIDINAMNNQKVVRNFGSVFLG